MLQPIICKTKTRRYSLCYRRRAFNCITRTRLFSVDEPDYVVVGECRTFNAEMMEAALNLLLGGLKFIATNLDENCPTNGMQVEALVSMLERASGVKPLVLASQVQ